MAAPTMPGSEGATGDRVASWVRGKARVLGWVRAERRESTKTVARDDSGSITAHAPGLGVVQDNAEARGVGDAIVPARVLRQRVARDARGEGREHRGIKNGGHCSRDPFCDGKIGFREFRNRFSCSPR